MKFFKPEDFGNRMTLEEIANEANAKLEREGKIIYGYKGKYSDWSYERDRDFGIHKYDKQALLINIEPIEKCTHPVEKVTAIIKEICFKYADGSKRYGQEFQCECGAHVKPKEFEEIIEESREQ